MIRVSKEHSFGDVYVRRQPLRSKSAEHGSQERLHDGEDTTPSRPPTRWRRPIIPSSPRPKFGISASSLGHVADAQMAMCGAVKGEMKRGDAASKTSKADLMAALKASFDYCDGVYNSMTDAEGAQTGEDVRPGSIEAQRAVFQHGAR